MTYHDRQLIADAWRGSLAEVSECLLWIDQHTRTIAAGTERPEYIAYCKRMLDHRLDSYRAAIRRVSEAEAAMIAAGIPFTRQEQGTWPI